MQPPGRPEESDLPARLGKRRIGRSVPLVERAPQGGRPDFWHIRVSPAQEEWRVESVDQLERGEGWRSHRFSLS